MRWSSRNLLLALSLLAGLCRAEAQTSIAAHTARSSAMGGCFLPCTEGDYISIAYGHAYLLAGMADKSVAASHSTGGHGRLGLGYTHHGNSDYHRQLAAFAYTLDAGRRVKVGAELHYCHLGTSDPMYTARQRVGGAATAVIAVGRRTGIMLLGGTQPQSEDMRPWLLAQVTHRPNALWLTVVEAEYTGRFAVHLGMEYLFCNILYLRAGIGSNPMTASFGAGAAAGRYRVDIGASVHSVLGVSPSLSISFMP